jgi:hypothetical protein
MANKPKDFPKFTKLDEKMAQDHLAKLNLHLANFTKATKITDITARDSTLVEIFDRIEKRRVYFHIFYNGCEMGELNEGALMCFWIAKLCPFTCPKLPPDILNAKIALFLFNTVVSFVAAKTKKKVHIAEQTIIDLFYSLRFRDISKEALMLLAESVIS